MSLYQALTEADAITLAQRVPELFPDGADLISNEIGDGNLNLVFRIMDKQTHKSVIIKQALPYAKVVGESWPLTLDRARIERDALEIHASLCPDLVPMIYAYHTDMALTVMEDLHDHVIMRQGLINGQIYPAFAEHITEFTSRTLFFTSDLGMNQQEKKERMKQFVNPELCKITEDLIFEHPYMDSETNDFNPAIHDAVELIWQDEALHLEVCRLRDGFLTHGQALLHGDLHTGSIFVTKSSTKVIDPEFAFYGPIGFDIGAILANLLLNLCGQEGWKSDEKALLIVRNYLLDTIEQVWNGFETKFRVLWDEQLVDRMFRTQGFQDQYMLGILQDTIGYTGCKMIRRIIGLASVADIETIPNEQSKQRAERLALSIGTALVKQHRYASSIKELITIVKKELEHV